MAKNIKSVSELIGDKSLKQKKYISLMLVPSYSTGTTRTIRLPRWIFHAICITILLIILTISGLFLRSIYLSNQVDRHATYLDEATDELLRFQELSEEERLRLLELLEDMDENTRQRISEYEQQFQINQQILDNILDEIQEILEDIRELETMRQELIDYFSMRAIHIPISDTLARLNDSQENIINNHEHINQVPSGIDENILLLRHELLLQQELFHDILNYKSEIATRFANHPTIWPLYGEISSGFGWRYDPFNDSTDFHTGIDIITPIGTQVRTTGGGVVTLAEWHFGYGLAIIIDHGFGFSTLYGHLSEIHVEKGQQVQREDIIGLTGVTGITTGPHLHYEVRFEGQALDPTPFLEERIFG